MIEEIPKVVKVKPVFKKPEREHYGDNTCNGKFSLELGVGLHCPDCGRWYLGEFE